MAALVVDASAVVELLLNTARGRRVGAQLGDAALNAPQLLDLEVVSVLNRLANAGKVTDGEAATAVEMFRALGIVRHDHEPLLDRVRALRDNLTAYDAAYVVLAEGLACPLLTCDTKLAAAPGHTAEVHLVG